MVSYVWYCMNVFDNIIILKQHHTTITTVIRSGMLRWYGHVMRTHDEGWVKSVLRSEMRLEDQLEDQERHG